MRGFLHTEGGYLAAAEGPKRPGRPAREYLPAVDFWKEHYIVETPYPYQAGQLADGGGVIFLFRLYDESGLVYEAALPAGNKAAPDSVKRETTSRTYRRVPYPDRIIGARDADPEAVAAFKQAARRWLVNEATRRGRPAGTTTYIAEDWFKENAKALSELRRENTRPTAEAIARVMGMPRSTYYDYQRKYGKPPR
jgi:hypothetical protein